MRAARITRLDGPDAVTVENVDEPAGDDLVVIDVHGAGVTFPDVLQTRGLYQMKPPLPYIPGAEVAGVVRSAPADSGFTAGDRVCAFPGIGGFAETVATAPAMVFPLPDRIDFTTGAGIPMNLLTAHFALTRRGRLAIGETVLVHGAAGGLGSATVQLAASQGAYVIAVTSTEEKATLARRAGAAHTIPVEGFKDAAKELTDGRGVDMVVDPVGGDRFTDSLRSLAPEGRVLVLGFTAGQIPTVKVNRLLLGNTAVLGVAWGEFWMRDPAYLQTQWLELADVLASGAVDPLIGATFPLEEAPAALELMDRRGALGKIVLTVR